MSATLAPYLEQILSSQGSFLEGVQGASSIPSLVKLIEEWAQVTGRTGEEIAATLEPCLRQSILMSLLPSRGIDPNYHGSIDAAISEHVAAIGVELNENQLTVLRHVCVNVRKYQGLDSTSARSLSWSIGQLKLSSPDQYKSIHSRQGGRCRWCGVLLDAHGVVESLDHVAPKILGDDLFDGSNWALACRSCNLGKGESLAWAARPESLDFMRRLDFQDPNKIGLAQRWAVLMRQPSCEVCGAETTDAELWAYRRVPTGLPVPSHCSTACGPCSSARGFEVLPPMWDVKEVSRPPIPA